MYRLFCDNIGNIKLFAPSKKRSVAETARTNQGDQVFSAVVVADVIGDNVLFTMMWQPGGEWRDGWEREPTNGWERLVQQSEAKTDRHSDDGSHSFVGGNGHEYRSRSAAMATVCEQTIVPPLHDDAA
jgi:hypothetical protein